MTPRSFHETPEAPHLYGANLTVGEKLARVHWPVIILLCLIAAVGVLSLYSVAGGSLTPWAERHIVRFVVGLALVLAIAVTPRELWLAIAYPGYLLALALLAIVPWLGTEVGGARRWITLAGDLTIQPSEIMKVAMVLALARYFQWLPARWVSNPVGIALPLAMIVTPAVFTLMQPDLGTAALFVIVGLAMMFLAGVNIAYYIAGAAGIIALIPMMWEQLHDYQRQRIEVFLDPNSDPLGAGYHIAQSKIALGAGGITGTGFMQGTQSKFDFLPEKHTDFIFTSLAEEWGLIGSIVLLALFLSLILALLIMALRCANQFARLTIAGAALVLFVYVFVNIAMVTGLIPVVGVPLPLISFGGTSMITVMFAIGLALCAYVHRERVFLRHQLGAFW